MKSREEKKAAMTNPLSFTEAAAVGKRFIKVKIHVFLGLFWKGKRTMAIGFLTPYNYIYTKLSHKFKGNQYLTPEDDTKL